jgi:HD-GYP domain-containing protein (c-di-GMP phosphodiesterase class II)
MDPRRITLSDIVIGEPLAWDVYDTSKRLLLRRGQIVERSQQIEELISRGLYIEVKNAHDSTDQSAAAAARETPSVTRLINRANKRLERLLFSIHLETDVQPSILEVVQVITSATNINSDIALACMLLNQEESSYAVRHAVDTAIVSLVIAKAMRKSPDETQAMMAAALTMNVGMLRDQEHLQQKAEALSEKDVMLIRSHPQQSVDMLRTAGVTHEEWLSYVLLHHENENGTGYPFGKTSDEIPENVKIIAIADRYCARVSARSYRKTLLPNAALREIMVTDKDIVDPQIVSRLIKILGIYPTGTFVQLQNGEIGVVTGKGASTTTPVVHALLGPRGAPLSFPIKRDTAKALFAVREVLHPDRAAVRCTMQKLWGAEAAA